MTDAPTAWQSPSPSPGVAGAEMLGADAVGGTIVMVRREGGREGRREGGKEGGIGGFSSFLVRKTLTYFLPSLPPSPPSFLPPSLPPSFSFPALSLCLSLSPVLSHKVEEEEGGKEEATAADAVGRPVTRAVGAVGVAHLRMNVSRGRGGGKEGGREGCVRSGFFGLFAFRKAGAFNVAVGRPQRLAGIPS